MDGEQHRAPTPNKRKRKKAKGGKGGNSVDRAGRDGESTSSGVVAQEKSVPTGTADRKQQGSSNINAAASQPQPHQTPVSPVKATDDKAEAAGDNGSGGGGGLGGKKSKKRRRKEAAQAAAAAAQAAQQHHPPPSPPGVVTAAAAAVASPHSGGGGSSAKKAKKAKKAKNKAVNSAGTAQRGGSPPAASPPGGLARGSSGGGGGSSGGPKVSAPASAGGSGAPRLSELQQRMRQKLEGAQFRMINETLYTSESKASLAKFKREPELFDVYHRGFREQVEKWPVHPLDIIIDWLGKYPKARVADFGCGEARLAATVPNKVHSFDLVSPNPRVTACDMANVPIKDASVHVAVFCLSLMGTNLADFLREAHRVLVPGGLVKVAEVRSRFEGEEGGVERFLEVTKRLGFDTRQMDRSNKMFLMAEFKKSKRKPEKGIDFEAKACIYKRR